MKRRYLESDEDSSTVFQRYERVGGVTTPLNQSTRWKSQDYLETEGWDLPNYWSRKKSGELLPFTPFRQYEFTGDASGSNSWTNGTTDWWWEPSGFNIYYPWRLTKDDLDSEAASLDASYFVQGAAAKIYSQGWDGATFAAELTKTVAMFRNLVRRTLTQVSRSRYENIWLEGRYGWRTLLYDMKDIEKALTSIDDGRQRFKERVGQTYKTTSVETELLEWSSSTMTITKTTETTVGRRGSVVADISPPKVQLNLAITAWEVTRFSFVLDWIINVGQFLEAMSFVAFSQQYTAAEGLLVQKRFVTELTDIQWHGNYSGTRYHIASSLGTLTIRRPTTVPSSPLTKLRLDSLKVLDLVGLLLQQLRR